MNGRSVTWLARVCALSLIFCVAPARAQAGDPSSPVFRSDSTGLEAVRAVESGASSAAKTTRDSLPAPRRADSLLARLQRRGPYVGLSLGAAFGAHSARDRFAADMDSLRRAAGQRQLQGQDPVHLYFPTGFLIGIPISRQFDALLRTEHSWYRVAGLAQKDNEAATEYWHVHQTHLAGIGLRWLVPASFLTVSGKPGLYVGYTRFWNFGPTGMRTASGSVRARTEAAGAGGEIQTGFQQDFDKRWTLTGSLAFTSLSFRSDGDWRNVTPTATAGEKAEWSVQSARFALQGMYQFGRKER